MLKQLMILLGCAVLLNACVFDDVPVLRHDAASKNAMPAAETKRHTVLTDEVGHRQNPPPNRAQIRQNCNERFANIAHPMQRGSQIKACYRAHNVL